MVEHLDYVGMQKSAELAEYYIGKSPMGIQRSLNGRPRETLGYRMPVEKLAELVALTG